MFDSGKHFFFFVRGLLWSARFGLFRFVFVFVGLVWLIRGTELFATMKDACDVPVKGNGLKQR